MKFHVNIWIFHALSIKIIFSEIATNPLTHGDGVAKPEFYVFPDI